MVVPAFAPIPLFPAAPRILFDAVPDAKLQGAVNTALAALVAARSGPIPFSLAIIDLNRGAESGILKWGGHRPHEEHYTASGVKMCALYAAYALMDMVTRFAGALGLLSLIAGAVRSLGATPPPPVPAARFDALRATMDLAIDTAGSKLLAKVPREERLPRYEQVFVTLPPGSPLPPAFTGAFLNSMRDMIVPSDNNAAGRCARGVGYAYLSGAMAAAGLFDAATNIGAWLSADYVAEPHRLVDTTNDGMVGQASSALSMAKLMAMIVNRSVLDKPACDAMRDLLAAAAKGRDIPYLTRTPRADSMGVEAGLRIPLDKLTHAKLGLGPLKVGGVVASETFRIEGLKKPGLSYAVSFQNMNAAKTSFDDVAFMLNRAISLYEA